MYKMQQQQQHAQHVYTHMRVTGGGITICNNFYNHAPVKHTWAELPTPLIPVSRIDVPAIETGGVSFHVVRVVPYKRLDEHPRLWLQVEQRLHQTAQAY